MDYKTLASTGSIAKTIEALKEHGVEAEVVDTGAEALEKIKQLIPQGASVMNGASKTLEEIGYIEYLQSGEHGWKNLKADILAEKDIAKQTALRKQATLSEYYLGSVHALSETGEFIVASNTGSQLPQIVFNSPNLILVVGTQKIVPSLDAGMKRLEEYVVPLEDANIFQKFGTHTMLSKVLIFKRENTRLGRKVHMILVHETLGF